MSSAGHLSELDLLRSQVADLSRQLAEQGRLVQESREQFQTLADLQNVMETIPDILFILNTQGNLVKWNQRLRDVTGYSPEELLNKPALAFVSQEDQSRAATAVQRGLTEGYAELEGHLLTKDHHLIPYHWTGAVLKNGHGESIGIVGIGRDVVEKKRVEAALRASEERYRALYDETPTMYFTLATDGTVRSVNRFGAEQLGYQAEELIGHSVLRVFHEQDKETVAANLAECLATPETTRHWEFRKVRKDGSIIWVQETVRVAQSGTGETVVSVTCEDVTERKQAEETRREMNMALANAMPGIARLDSNGRYLLVNEMYASGLGYDPSELIGRDWSCTVFRGHRPRAEAAFATMLQEGKGEFEALALRKDGSTFWKQVLMVRIVDRDGSHLGYHCFMRDITDRMQAEEKILESQQRLQAVVEGTSDAVFMKDVKGRYLLFNSAAAKFVGKKPEEVIGHDDTFLFPHDDAQFLMEQDRAVMVERQVKTQEEHITTADGQRRTFFSTKGPLFDSDGEVIGLFGVARDITERYQAEELIKEAERRYRTIFEQAGAGVAQIDSHTGRFVQVNRRYCEIVGLTEAEMLRISFKSITHPDDLQGDLDNMARLLCGEIPSFIMEKRYLRKDGSIVWVNLNVAPLWRPGEKPTHHIAIVEDITERKRTEEALRESEQAIRALHEATAAPGLSFDERMQAVLEVGCRRFSLPIGMLARVVDEKLEFTHVHAPGTSFTAGMAVPLRVANCDTPLQATDPTCCEQAGASVCQHDLEYKAMGLECYLRTQMTGRDRVYGTVCFVDQAPRLDAFTQADKDFLQLMARWISGELDRRAAEQALKQSEARYHALYDDTPTMYFTLATDGTVLSVNRFGAEQLGYQVEELVGHSVLGIFYDEDKETVATSLSECLATPETTRHWEFRKVRKDGVIIWVRETVRVGMSFSGEIIVLVTCEDITARKRVEEELRKSHAFIRQVIDTDPNFIFAKDRAGRFILVNKAVANVYGTTVEDLIGKTDADFNVNEKEVAFFRQKDLEVMDSHQDLFIPEETVTDSTGRTRWLQTVKRPILDEQGRAIMVLGAATDITERKRMEEALRQRERDLQAALQERERISQDLHDGILQSLFAVGLTLETAKSMMAPRARKTSGPPLDQAIKQLNLVMREIRNFIAGLGSDLLQGKDLPTALQHMLASLTENQVTHVRLAVEDRAAKAVSTEQSLHLLRVIQEAVSNCIRHGRAREARVSLKMLKQGVRLSIRDNGRGFNPTTAKGGGHGLRNMAARAQKMGGRLTVLSKMNEGTRVVLDLPKEASNVPC